MKQRIFSFSVKEQLIVMLQNVNNVEQKSAPALQRRLAYKKEMQKEEKWSEIS